MKHINKLQFKTLVTTREGLEKIKKTFRHRIIKVITLGAFVIVLVMAAFSSVESISKSSAQPAILYMEDMLEESLLYKHIEDDGIVYASEFMIDTEDVVEAAEFK